jgi:hypothetical protein
MDYPTRRDERRAADGLAGIKAGTPDYGKNGDGIDGIETDAADAIANIMHRVKQTSGDVDLVVDRARMNFLAEVNGED